MLKESNKWELWQNFIIKKILFWTLESSLIFAQIFLSDSLNNGNSSLDELEETPRHWNPKAKLKVKKRKEEKTCVPHVKFKYADNNPSRITWLMFLL